jgi:translation initiation factor 2B subunit (eIF-2B alpha/beta/delta family)
MNKQPQIEELVKPIRNDLTSGAAELALQGIKVFRSLMSDIPHDEKPEMVRDVLIDMAKALVKAQPAMAPMFHLGNTVLIATKNCKTTPEIMKAADDAFTQFETRLCESASQIADHCYDLIPAGELVFAYSFSSTVVSSLLHARSQRKFFRAVCTEARPSQEGRKLAAMLASAGLEVIHTFDPAMGLVLPMCRAAFMGCDAVARPGIVNKVGSWLLALACRELGIPLYALCGTEKFVSDERLFEFEDYERPGSEVWADPPGGVRVLNKQYELIPFSWLAGVVTEHGILHEKDIDQYVSKLEVHPALRLEGALIANS